MSKSNITITWTFVTHTVMDGNMGQSSTRMEKDKTIGNNITLCLFQSILISFFDLVTLEEGSFDLGLLGCLVSTKFPFLLAGRSDSIWSSATKTFLLTLVDLTKGAGVRCETIEGLCDELAVDSSKGNDGDNTKIGTSAGDEVSPVVAGSVSLFGGLLARLRGSFAGLPRFLFCPRGIARTSAVTSNFPVLYMSPTQCWKLVL